MFSELQCVIINHGLAVEECAVYVRREEGCVQTVGILVHCRRGERAEAWHKRGGRSRTHRSMNRFKLLFFFSTQNALGIQAYLPLYTAVVYLQT